MSELRVSGLAPEDVCEVSDLAWTERWDIGPCGPINATWRLDLPPTVSVPWLARGAPAQIYDGSTAGFGGIMREPVKTAEGWECSARGYAPMAEDWPALTADGTPTSNVAIALTVARDNGWPVILSTDHLPNVNVATTDTRTLNTVLDVANAYCESTGLRFHVGADRRVRFLPDPTVPAWSIAPSVPLMSTADEQWRSRIIMKYIRLNGDGTTEVTVLPARVNAAAEKRWGYKAAPVDRTGLGPMTVISATSLADQLLAQVAPRMGWDGSLTLTPRTLTTLTDAPARMLMVRAGHMFRGQGYADLQGTTIPQPALDFVAGEVRHAARGEEVTVAAVGRVDRGLDEILKDQPATEEQLTGVRTGAFTG